MPLLLAALLLGFVAGLRTFTAPAVLWLMRHASPIAYVLGVLAIAEFVGDLHPQAPARTRAVGLLARAISGAFCGWIIASPSGLPGIGAAVGAFGAIAGAYIGLALRMRAIAPLGNVPAGILEDIIAIAAAVLIVSYA